MSDFLIQLLRNLSIL